MNVPYKAIALPQDNIEWLKMRKKGIGGSDAAAALGLSPWLSRIGLYNDKISTVIQEEDPEKSEMLEWGHRSEDMIAKKFQENHLEYRVNESIFMYKSKDHPFMLANVDRTLDSFKSNGMMKEPDTITMSSGLEIKTARAEHYEKWSTSEYGIPDQYMLQIQHYMSVMGWDYMWVACLFGGRKYYEVRIERNQAIIDMLIKGEQQFWNMVLRREIPAVDEHTTSDDINAAYPPGDAEDMAVLASSEDMNDLSTIKALDSEIKDLSTKKEVFENRIKSRIGNSTALSAPGWKVTWKPQTRTSIDKKKLIAAGLDMKQYESVSEFRVLKITKEK